MLSKEELDKQFKELFLDSTDSFPEIEEEMEEEVKVKAKTIQEQIDKIKDTF